MGSRIQDKAGLNSYLKKDVKPVVDPYSALGYPAPVYPA